MKRNNKKGFTIVELVIVIAVIAILSAVLIPTFGSIIEDANETSALQKASNAYKQYMIDTKADDTDLVISVDGKYWYTVTDGQLSDEAVATDPGSHHATAYDLSANDAGINLYLKGTCSDGTDTDTVCDVCGGTVPTP